MIEWIKAAFHLLRKTDSGEYWQRFTEAMNDDFNTARGIGILFEAVRTGNRLLDSNDPDGAAESTLKTIQADLRKIGGILGILNETPENYFKTIKKAVLQEEAIDAQWVEGMIQARKEARAAKDWARADQIRDELEARNIVLEDRPDGTIWKVVKS